MEETTAHENVGKGKNQMHYSGIQSSSERGKKSHPVRSVWGPSRGCGISLVILHLPPSCAV